MRKLQIFLVIVVLIPSLIFGEENSSVNTSNSLEQEAASQKEKELEDKLNQLDEGRKHPILAGIIGLLPGAGQAFNRNFLSATMEATTFVTFLGISSYYAKQPDYIKDKDRYVQYDMVQSIAAGEMQRNNLLYREYPLFTETSYNRDIYLIKHGRTVEINPLIRYGSYYRTSYSTIYSDLGGQGMLDTIFYSSYSAYRDAGGRGSKYIGEQFWELGIAPFHPKHLISPFVFVPLLGLLVAGLTGGLNSDKVTLAPPGIHQSGTIVGGYVGAQSFGAGVGEEAFFRGFLNTELSRQYGPYVGGAISGVAFGMAHYANGTPGFSNTVFPMLAGFYFAFVQHFYKGDIRYGIAAHFWWDFIIFAFQAKSIRENRNWEKSQQEIHFMPIQYTLKF